MIIDNIKHNHEVMNHDHRDSYYFIIEKPHSQEYMTLHVALLQQMWLSASSVQCWLRWMTCAKVLERLSRFLEQLGSGGYSVSEGFSISAKIRFFGVTFCSSHHIMDVIGANCQFVCQN